MTPPPCPGAAACGAARAWRAPSLAAGLLAAGLWAASALAAAATLQVRVGPEGDYGPFTYRDGSGQIAGMSVDLVNSMQRTGGAEIVWLGSRPLAEWLAAAKSGQVDLLLALRPTPERSAFLDFSPPYVRVPAVLALRKGRRSQATLGDLGGLAVGVGKGYAVEGFVRKAYPAVRWAAYPDDRAALAALRSGTLEAVVADAASIRFVLEREAWADVEVHAGVGFTYDLALAWPKGRQDIAAWVDGALRSVPQAERDALARRWIDIEPVRFHGWGNTGVTAALLALLAIGLVTGSVVLRRQGAPAQR